MIIYFAGNFPVMKNPELEKQFRDRLLETQSVYPRLISYYYQKDIKNLIDIKKEEMHGCKPKRTNRSNVKD